MTRIVWSRVVLGGLTAGAVIAAGRHLLDGQWLATGKRAALLSLGRPDTSGDPNSLAYWTGASLLVGLAGVWLYASLRPSFGAGPRTALRTALIVWLTASLAPGLAQLALDLWPAHLTLITLLADLPLMTVAMLIGAALYKES